MEISEEDCGAKAMGKGWWVSRFYDVWGGEMMTPPPSYLTQARGEAMMVFSVFSKEVGPTQEEGS